MTSLETTFEGQGYALDSAIESYFLAKSHLCSPKNKEKKPTFCTNRPPNFETIKQSKPFSGLTFEGESLPQIRHEAHILPEEVACFWLTIHHHSGKDFPRIVCLPSGSKPKGLIQAWREIPLELATCEAKALLFWKARLL